MNAFPLRFSHHARIAFAVALLCLSLMPRAKAEIKNFAFSGTITSFSDNAFQLDGSVAVGTPFVGFYVFDTATANSNTTDATVGDYWFTDAKFGVTVKVGNYVFRTNAQHVNFLMELVNRSTDNYLLRSYNNVSSPYVPVGGIAWQLDDSSGTALTNVVLPAIPPTLSRWQSLFGLTINSGSTGPYTYFIRGTVSEIHANPVLIPETPAVTLGDAVEVKWQSVLGYYYQIEKSGDLQTWTNVDAPVLGDGSLMSRFYTRDRKNVFYRAEIANFQK